MQVILHCLLLPFAAKAEKVSSFIRNTHTYNFAHALHYNI